MLQKNWSDYDKFVVLSDRSRGRLGSEYGHFIKFKTIVETLKKMRSTQGNMVVVDGEVIDKKKITSSEATNILSNIYECKWDNVTEKMLLVASQLGVSLR